MSLLSRLPVCILLLAAPPVWAQTTPPSPQPDPQEQEVGRLINAGAVLAQQGHAAEALTQDLDPAVAKADAKIASEHRRIYAARTAQESLLYLLQAANAHQEAVTLSATWGQAYFFKGYLLNELGRSAEARAFMQHALDLSPMNAQYLAEMGNIEIKDKNLDAALAHFVKGEEAANAYSPDTMKAAELGRVVRGEGYVYVEQHKLDQAEAAYRRCLSINPSDQRAARELQFVLTQEGQQTPAPTMTPSAQPGPNNPPGNETVQAIFLFSRANYFHAAVALRQCTALYPTQVAAIDDRFEKLRARLAAKYGETLFPAGKAPDAKIDNKPCDVMTVNSYSAHVAEVEALPGLAQP